MKGVSTMETKNVIIQQYARSIVDAAITIENTTNNFADSASDENNAIVKTLNILVESLRSQTVIFQGALDSYTE